MVLLGTAFVPTSSPLCPCTPLLPFLLLLLEPSHPSVQKRPADYFAEMLKTDDHMAKIRDVMLKDQEKIERAERNKKTREMKKFGKQVRACMCVRVRCGFLFLRLWSCCAALECHHGFDDLHESRLTTLSLTHSHTHTHTLTHSLSLSAFRRCNKKCCRSDRSARRLPCKWQQGTANVSDFSCVLIVWGRRGAVDVDANSRLVFLMFMHAFPPPLWCCPSLTALSDTKGLDDFDVTAINARNLRKERTGLGKNPKRIAKVGRQGCYNTRGHTHNASSPFCSWWWWWFIPADGNFLLHYKTQPEIQTDGEKQRQKHTHTHPLSPVCVRACCIVRI